MHVVVHLKDVSQTHLEICLDTFYICLTLVIIDSFKIWLRNDLIAYLFFKIFSDLCTQVEELLQRKRTKEASEKELRDFVQLLMSAKAMPPRCKPLKCSWTTDEKIKYRIESLEAYAIDACKNDDQKRTAGMVFCINYLSSHYLLLDGID